jgi:hypothetical protein
MNDVSRELGSALGIAILGSMFSSGYRSAVGDAAAALPPEAAHAVEESAGAGFSLASQLGSEPLADAVRHAFAAGLSDAMAVGAGIAVVTAAFALWRGPRRTSPVTVEIPPVATADPVDAGPGVDLDRQPEPVG